MTIPGHWISCAFQGATLIEPDVQISRIRLSDKTSRLHPRHVVPKPGQAYEPEVPVKVREWIAPALASPDRVLGAQPPAQPHSRVVVERPVRFVDGPCLDVARPSAGAERFSSPTSSVASCQVPFRWLSTWAFSTLRLMLFCDGRYPRRARPALAEYIRANLCPRKSSSPSGTVQSRAFSSLIVSFSLPCELARSLQGLFGVAPPTQDHGDRRQR